jgi:hypothetical protein
MLTNAPEDAVGLIRDSADAQLFDMSQITPSSRPLVLSHAG